MDEFRRTHSMNANNKEEEVLEEVELLTKENKEPSLNENNFLKTSAFVVDLLTQEDENHSIESPTEGEGSTATVIDGLGGWASRQNQWTRVFQTRSTEQGTDWYVDQEALGEVATSLLRDFATEKSAAKKCGREY